MKFILLIRGEDKFNALAPSEAQAMVEKFSAWAQKLRSENRLVDAEGLAPTGRIISSEDGVLTDGPFAETREMVGGYYTFTADSLEHAIEIAKECPGLLIDGSLELRPAMTYHE